MENIPQNCTSTTELWSGFFFRVLLYALKIESKRNADGMLVNLLLRYGAISLPILGLDVATFFGRRYLCYG